jgi:TetR/AcrR family transcriptional regulator
MPKKARLSLRDLEQETEKSLKPTTDKEKSIIEAATSLLGERGVDGATTAEIARRAGVTEKTLFRYFPSKRDLVKRILFPPLLRGALDREWGKFEVLLKTDDPSLKSWYSMITARRYAAIKDPALARTVLIELTQNDEFRDAVGKLWHEHIWRPMLDKLADMQAKGAVRKEVDIETLARAIHCLNLGYFLVRHLFATGRKWDDAVEIEKMSEILAHGSSEGSSGS